MSKYLVIQLARFGDIMQTKRLILGLTARPGAEVHLVVDTSLVSLAKLIYPGVHVHGLPVHGTVHGRRPGSERLLRDCRSVCKHWQETGFEHVFNLNHSNFNHTLAGLFAPEQVSGYRWHRGQALRGAWPEMVFRLTRHRLANPLNLMDYWGHFLRPAWDPALVNPPARPQGGGVGVVLAGKHARRSLPVQVLAQILTAALRNHAGQAYLLGTELERPAARQLRGCLSPALQGRVFDLTGRTDWQDLLEVVGQLDLLLSPDTGTMHLAAHLGIPVLAFFLSSAWCFETGPYGAGHLVWQAGRSCAPCLESQACDQDLACLQPFTHKAVLTFLAGQISPVSPAFAPPSELYLLESRVNDFGLNLTPRFGELPESKEREVVRELLRGHCLGITPGDVAAEGKAAAWLYDETHWML
jgi:ADP-heptose:LPS heptosyltransferase